MTLWDYMYGNPCTTMAFMFLIVCLAGAIFPIVKIDRRCYHGKEE